MTERDQEMGVKRDRPSIPALIDRQMDRIKAAGKHAYVIEITETCWNWLVDELDDGRDWHFPISATSHKVDRSCINLRALRSHGLRFRLARLDAPVYVRSDADERVARQQKEQIERDRVKDDYLPVEYDICGRATLHE